MIRPDGRCTCSRASATSAPVVIDCARVAAEVLGMPWEKVDRQLGQHGEEPAVELRVGRQPDDARDDARGARRGADDASAEAAGDRREGARRRAGADYAWPTSASPARRRAA